MADHPEVIRQQMEETRSNLTEKLEALESQVADTVQTTTATVAEAVETVKDTVENVTETVETVTESVKETVESMGETFNLWTQADRHPWMVFGGSVLVGLLGAQLFGGSSRESEEEEDEEAPTSSSWYSAPQPQASPPQRQWQASQASSPSYGEEQPAHEEKSWFWDEMGKLKGLAIGTLMGVVRDLTKQVVPAAISDRVVEEVNNLTTHLGGEPVKGEVLPSNK